MRNILISTNIITHVHFQTARRKEVKLSGDTQRRTMMGKTMDADFVQYVNEVYQVTLNQYTNKLPNEYKGSNTYMYI